MVKSLLRSFDMKMTQDEDLVIDSDEEYIQNSHKRSETPIVQYKSDLEFIAGEIIPIEMSQLNQAAQSETPVVKPMVVIVDDEEDIDDESSVELSIEDEDEADDEDMEGRGIGKAEPLTESEVSELKEVLEDGDAADTGAFRTKNEMDDEVSPPCLCMTSRLHPSHSNPYNSPFCIPMRFLFFIGGVHHRQANRSCI
jgi:hypothetical protein